MSKKKLDKLLKEYREAKNVDKSIFAEQRSNILLKSGEHYKKKETASITPFRGGVSTSKSNKILLVKNLLHRVCNIYENSILENCPIPSTAPFNEGSLHDTRISKVNDNIFKWVMRTNKFDNRQEEFIGDYITFGEVFAKVYFDYDKGITIGSDPETGLPIKAGEFVVQRILPYNIKRDPDALSLDEARYLIEDEALDNEALFKLAFGLGYPDVDKLRAKYDGKNKQTIFDSSTGKYKEVQGKVQLHIKYVRPVPENPDGEYVVYTDSEYIGRAPLPLGIFPIVYTGFDRLASSARHSSIIRVCKPFQVEYNRVNSKMAEHQITIGDDKIFLLGNSTITGGKLKEGLRTYRVAGKEPVIMSGRTGEQYLGYAEATKRDLYEAANIDYELIEKQPTGDAYQMLYASIKDKKKYIKYTRKYERFIVDVFTLIKDMSRSYLTDIHLVKILGKEEAIDITEYKELSDAGFEVTIETVSGDTESKFGKVLTLTHMMQYLGSSMTPAQMGYIFKQLPYGGGAEVINTMTMQIENAENLILALDRGDYIPTMKYDDHEFLINALYTRMKKSDYLMLPMEIKGLYEKKIQELEQSVQLKQQAVQQATMGMIPQGGTFITVNTSLPDPATGQMKRIKLPSESVQWLLDKLSQQGAFVEQASQGQGEILADIGMQQQAISPEQNMPQA